MAINAQSKDACDLASHFQWHSDHPTKDFSAILFENAERLQALAQFTSGFGYLRGYVCTQRAIAEAYSENCITAKSHALEVFDCL